ncbi:hypothetical protein D3C85_1486520 [compost metagenome]
MNVSPATIRITFSILVIALKYLPNFSILKAMMNAKTNTGNPVPKENAIGIVNPASEESVIGISIPKNNAPL